MALGKGCSASPLWLLGGPIVAHSPAHSLTPSRLHKGKLRYGSSQCVACTKPAAVL